MDFNFTDDQEQLRDAVRKWVDKGHDFDRHRAIARAGGFSAEQWAELAGLGLTGLAVPEDHGGMGFGPVDAMVVMEELGRGLVVQPYAAVALVAARLLAESGAAEAAQWLQGIADGSERVVLAHQERAARYRLNHVVTRAERAGEAWSVSGADDDATGIALFLVTASQAGVKTRPYVQQDGSAAAELTLDKASASLLFAPGAAFEALERAQDVAIAAQCAEGVGLMEKLLGLTADYLNTRKQFGVPIASFQALRHRISDMKMQLELGRSMSYYATLKLTEPAPQRRRALSQAKVQLARSMRYVGQEAVQLHGGIGVTDEYAGAHYFKRLTCLELSFGDVHHHLGEVSARMQDSAGVFA